MKKPPINQFKNPKFVSQLLFYVLLASSVLTAILFFKNLIIGGSGFDGFMLLLLTLMLVSSLGLSILRQRNSIHIGGNLNLEEEGRLQEFARQSISIINSIEEGVVTIDQQGLIKLINPEAQKITGWQEKDSLEINYATIVKLVSEDGKEINDVDNPIAIALSTGQSSSARNFFLKTFSNKTMPISVLATPTGDGSGIVIVTFRNIASEIADEREQREFISTASHEMRTPVTAIEGYLGLAMNPKIAQIDDRAREYLLKAQESSRHLGELFTTLLNISKTEDGRMEINTEVVDLVYFAGQVVDNFVQQASAKGIELRYLPHNAQTGVKQIAPVVYIEADRKLLREAIANLLENAIKYTKSGWVEVDVNIEKDDAVFKVTDSGIGIPPEDIPHLFQKFYRVDNSQTREENGTGLGLYLTRKVVEKMHGRIWATSVFGEGSSFFVAFARLDQQQARAKLQTQNLLQAAPKPEADPAAYPTAKPQFEAPANFVRSPMSNYNLPIQSGSPGASNYQVEADRLAYPEARQQLDSILTAQPGLPSNLAIPSQDSFTQAQTAQPQPVANNQSQTLPSENLDFNANLRVINQPTTGLPKPELQLPPEEAVPAPDNQQPQPILEDLSDPELGSPEEPIINVEPTAKGGPIAEMLFGAIQRIGNERKAAAERKRQEAEAERIRLEQEEAEKKKRLFMEAEAKRKREAEEAKRLQEEAEKARQGQERIKAEAEREAAEEAARIERERAEAKKQAFLEEEQKRQAAAEKAAAEAAERQKAEAEAARIAKEKQKAEAEAAAKAQAEFEAKERAKKKKLAEEERQKQIARRMQLRRERERATAKDNKSSEKPKVQNQQQDDQSMNWFTPEFKENLLKKKPEVTSAWGQKVEKPLLQPTRTIEDKPKTTPSDTESLQKLKTQAEEELLKQYFSLKQPKYLTIAEIERDKESYLKSMPHRVIQEQAIGKQEAQNKSKPNSEVESETTVEPPQDKKKAKKGRKILSMPKSRKKKSDKKSKS